MRAFAPRPVLLVLTLALIVGAIIFIQGRFDTVDSGAARAAVEKPPPSGPTTEGTAPERRGATEGEQDEPRRTGSGTEQTADEGSVEEGAREDATRMERKESEYRRAREITAPTGFVNTDAVSIAEARGEKVVLVEFWTYTCYNCRNVQPYVNSWHEEYEDDGLLVVGVHRPEFEFEKDRAGVEEAVRLAGIEYPVVLDNASATWDAYDNRYWPAFYLVDADGFVRYQHFGEGAYQETEGKIRELLTEKDRS